MPWVRMTQEEVKSVQVGQKIKVNGVETEVTFLYKRPNDYGFEIEGKATFVGKFCPVANWADDTIPDSAVTSYFDQNTFEKYQE